MKDIKVFYWLGEPNFGDMLNINICQKLFDINPIEAQPQDCEAAFLGSVLDDFLYKNALKFNRKFRNLYNKPPVKIWGSGFITKKNKFVKRKFKLPETYFRRFECYAMRGKLSLKRLQNIDKKQNFDKVVIGDPGLLAPMLLEKMPKKKYKVGLIPHHIELKMPIWEYIQNNLPNSTIIRVDGGVEDTIRKIAECEVILSSAMHGLIVADGFNIPNARIIASDRLVGGDYKFNDYYSAFGIENHKKINLNEQKIDADLINSVISDYAISKETVDSICKRLIDCFPYKN